MIEVELLRAGAGLLSALGGIAVYKFNVAQSAKSRADLIEQFEQALSQRKIHATCELFRMLHGLRMDYNDIEKLCESSKAIKIIYALKKTGGVVKYENGRFQYTKLFERGWVRTTNKYAMRVLAYLLGGMTVALISVMALLDGPASFAIIVFVIPVAAFFSMQLKDIRHDMMVESLVDGSEA